MNTQVTIVGGGPAGAATAIALSRLGLQCVVIEEVATAQSKPGETLPPNAMPVLQELGISHLLQTPQHNLCTGNKVIWGAPDPQERYFLAEPYGNGWHLDRALFEGQLREHAAGQGVQWHSGLSFVGMAGDADSLQIEVQAATAERMRINSDFVVDASGRRAIVARRQGVLRNRLDGLTGYFAILDTGSRTLAGATLIEAVADGWWYAAPLKDNKIVINYMTDANLQTVQPDNIQKTIFDKLQQTKHAREVLQVEGPGSLAGACVKPASTSTLDQLTGDRWLAVGDAACTYDPISSYGMTSAMGGGLYAALAIRDHLAGKAEALNGYTYVQQHTFNNCMAMLQHQYRLEQRWKDNSFLAAATLI